MNIFILDRDPVLAAQYQCDKHVVKMVLETAQIMSTIAGGPYKPTHAKHPCVRWAEENLANYMWLSLHGEALCAEYTHRYGKMHKSQAVIKSCSVSALLTRPRPAAFVQCIPEQYRQEDPVEAYRAYYRGDKARFATWTNREVPFWWSQNENHHI